MTILGTGRWVKWVMLRRMGDQGKRRKRKLEREEEGEEIRWG